MSFTHLIKYALSLEPQYAVKQSFKFLSKRLLARYGFLYGSKTSSFNPNKCITKANLSHILDNFSFPNTKKNRLFLKKQSQKIFQHRFNILGSGEKEIFHGMECSGFLGCSYSLSIPISGTENLINNLNTGNRPIARKIRALISEDYIPIDWQLDFKSGFRWREDIPSKLITYGHKPGVDVKVPWELSRLHHLPQLALASFLYKSNSENPCFSEKCKTEFINQTLDFISTNPPGWGVNWVCSMDVAIRIVNLILAFEIFIQNGEKFNNAFIKIFISTLISHASHIARNLEWDPKFRGNHYLANILGLLFVGSILCDYGEADLWLAFGIQELISESKNQFLKDGANFEASTNYHRLSSEIVAIGTALIFGISDNKRNALLNINPSDWKFKPYLKKTFFDSLKEGALIYDNHFIALFDMANFTMQVTKPNGTVIQLGDNDSGRILKLSPPDISNLDHRHLLASINALLDNEDVKDFLGTDSYIEADLVKSLAKGKIHKSSKKPLINTSVLQTKEPGNMHPFSQINVCCDKIPLSTELETIKFDEFGLYIWRSKKFFLSVRCGSIGQNGRGGHAHNDQLAIELQIDGQDWILDPGSFVYTPEPKLRDAYRSVFAHSSPRIGKKEPSKLTLGMFRLENNSKSKCLRFDKKGFLGLSYSKNDLVFRRIKINSGSLQIYDGIVNNSSQAIDLNVKTAYSPADLKSIFNLTLPFSSHYGFIE